MIFGMLNLVFWSKDITANIKRKIYNTFFQSIVLYGSETRSLMKRQKERLLALKIDFFRRSAGKLGLERGGNKTVRETMNIKKNITRMFKEKQLGWFRPVRRTGQEKLPRLAFEWEPEVR